MQNNKSKVDTLVYGKVPPQAPDLEIAVLGACLLERDTFDAVIDILPHADIFYIDTHRSTYSAMLKLHRAGAAIDLLTVTAQLRKDDQLENIGGPYFLTGLTNSVVSTAHVEAHAKIVYEKFLQREIIRVSSGLIKEAYEDSTDVFPLLDEAQNAFQVISDIPGAGQAIHISASAAGVLNDIAENRLSAGNITGIPTGYPTMDEKMYGFQKTDLTILAARPAVGKTAFALNLAFNAARDPHKKTAVCIFSLEMGEKRITKRALAFTSKIDLGLINRPKNLTELDMATMKDLTTNNLSRLQIFLDDTAVLTTVHLRNKCRKLMRRYPDSEWLFILDYLQLMTSTDTRGNREQQVSQISRGLKLIAKELNVPVIALSQINRTKDDDDEPELKDLRESGAIEQDADNVMFLYRPSKKLISENSYFSNKIMLKGAKFRDGETFELALQFDKSFQLFTEPAPLITYGTKPAKGPQPIVYRDVPANNNPALDDIPF